MKFSQLKAAFELHCGTADLVDAAELAIWFNEAQNDLALYFAPAVRAAYFEGQNQAADGISAADRLSAPLSRYLRGQHKRAAPRNQ